MGDYDLRLVVFDVDGTLVDSIGDIYTAMNIAYEGIGLVPPNRAAVQSTIGLPLEVAFSRLSTEVFARNHDALIAGYNRAYAELMAAKDVTGPNPFFPGARSTLEALRKDPWTILAIATGMSKQGLDRLIAGQGMQGWFTSLQTPDFQPSKPSPVMLEAILAETGVPVARAVMIGDTVYDMQMAKAAGMAALGVSWGYHPKESLQSARADMIIDTFDALPKALDTLLGGAS